VLIVRAAVPGVLLTVRAYRRVYDVTVRHRPFVAPCLNVLPVALEGVPGLLGVARDDANAMRPGVDWISVAPQLAAASPRLEVRNILVNKLID
jgi:hypothetical protein